MSVRLTKRQHETLLHLVKGMTNADIANTMCIKPRTVESHVSELLSKFNFDSRLQLAVAFSEDNLNYYVENNNSGKLSALYLEKNKVKGIIS